jgi:O-antigen/teichoic acid export membrane protein
MGEMMILWVLGAEYASVAALLPYSMILIGPYFWLISFRSLFVSQNKYTHLIVSNLIGVVTFSLVAVMLSKEFGEKGILLGLAAGLALSSLWQFLYLHKTRYMK